MNYGIDFLGGARYQRTVLKKQPRDKGFGIFLEVDGFGEAYDLINKVAEKGVPFIRVQVLWKDDHKFRPSDVKEIEDRCEALAPIVNSHKLKWYISPCCEHELSTDQFEPFADAVNRILPDVEIVNSPVKGKGHVSKKYINEYHHEKPRSGSARFSFSYDGSNCVDSNITEDKNLYRNSEYFMIWNSQCNGNRKVFKPGDTRKPKDYIDRSKRIYWPTDKQIDSWVYLINHEKGDTDCPRQNGGLLKSHGDQNSMPPAGKEQKPVWVKYPKWSAIEVRTRSGKLIDTARYYGPFEGGGYRYYHTEWGFTLAEKARKLQGDSICDVFGGGEKIGTINLAFRDPTYR